MKCGFASGQTVLETRWNGAEQLGQDRVGCDEVVGGGEQLQGRWGTGTPLPTSAHDQ